MFHRNVFTFNYVLIDLDSLEMDDAMEETPNNNVDIQADSDNGSPQANIEEDVNSNQVSLSHNVTCFLL